MWTFEKNKVQSVFPRHPAICCDEMGRLGCTACRPDVHLLRPEERTVTWCTCHLHYTFCYLLWANRETRLHSLSAWHPSTEARRENCDLVSVSKPNTAELTSIFTGCWDRRGSLIGQGRLRWWRWSWKMSAHIMWLANVTLHMYADVHKHAHTHTHWETWIYTYMHIHTCWYTHTLTINVDLHICTFIPWYTHIDMLCLTY